MAKKRNPDMQAEAKPSLPPAAVVFPPRTMSDFSTPARLALASLAYFLAQVLAFRFPDSFGLVAAIWPAAGIALASLLLAPTRLWPALLGCLFAAGIAANLTTDRSFIASAGFMLANISETTVSAWLLTRLCGDRIRFNRLREVLVLAAAASLVNAATSLIGAAFARFTISAPYWEFYRTWWVADGLGLLLITPLIVAWADSWRTLAARSRERPIEFISLFAVSCALAWFVFGWGNTVAHIELQPYLLVMCVIWVSFRFGPLGTVTLVGVISLLSIVLTASGAGTFPLGGADTPMRLLAVQVFLGVLGLTGLVLAAVENHNQLAEAALVESENRFRNLVENTTDWVWEIDTNGVYTYASPAVRCLLGYSPEDVLGKTPFDLMPAEEAKRVSGIFGPVVAEHKPLRYLENINLHKDGRQVILETSAGPFFDPNGIFMGYRGIDRDITARKQAEEELQGNKARLSSALEMAHLGHWEYDVASDLFTFNDQFYKLFRTTAAQAGGYTMHPAEYAKRFVHPDDMSMVGEETRKAIETEDPHFNRQIEHRVSYADGTAGHIAVRFFIVKDSHGKTVKTYGVNQDITERKQAEAERERLMIAIEQAGETIVITDPKGTIQFVNSAFEKISGYTRQEAIGMNPRVLKSGRQDEAFYRTMWEEISSGKTWSGRLVNKRKDGTLYTEGASISAVRDAAGKIVNYVAVKRDITDQIQLESQLRQSQKMETVGLLAGGVAHDFNNILTAIKGYSSMVSKNLRPDDPNLADMREIIAASERATTLTRQLLAFSRKQIMAPKVVDLNKSLGDMQNMLRRIIGEDIRLSTKLFSAPCLAKVDPGLMEQIVMNLVLNARDAVSKDGEITLETSILSPSPAFSSAHPDLAPGQLVCVKVRDNGCGMGPEEQKHLFEPFYTTKEKYKGTGLGLSMVFGTVKQSGGEIVVESEPGVGSSFGIYFPLVEAVIPEKAASATVGVSKGGTETVLLVEDEEPLRRLGERLLRAQGYTVITAADGGEALAAAGRYGKPVDLLLTDLVMPGMSGRELALELERRKLALRTLYMSGYTDEAIVKHGVLEPGIAFIYKPFTADALYGKLREVLDGPADQAKA